jgi:hypothetical protein
MTDVLLIGILILVGINTYIQYSIHQVVVTLKSKSVEKSVEKTMPVISGGSVDILNNGAFVSSTLFSTLLLFKVTTT